MVEIKPYLVPRHKMQESVALWEQRGGIRDVDRGLRLVAGQHPDHDAGVEEGADGPRHRLLQPILHARRPH